MNRGLRWAAGLLLAIMSMTGAGNARAAEAVTHGLFKDIQVTRPAGAPNRVVLLLADGGGSGAPAAEALTAAGAMVARIDTPAFLVRLAAEGGRCSFADGAFENLAHHLEAFYKLPTYMAPVLVGLDDHAALAYAVLAQSTPGTFAGGVSVGFCPLQTVKPPLCPGKGLRSQARAAGEGVDLEPAAALGAPWTALQEATDAACSPRAAEPFAATAAPGRVVGVPDTSASRPAAWLPALQQAYASLPIAAAATVAPPASLAGLPIVEVPATGGRDDRFAVLLSGDGGWAGIDKGVAKALAASGIPVAGFDSLRYFWSARTPQGLADDLDRVVRYYAARWDRRRVMLIGYSQGADVLPFAVNRLPPATRARVQSTVLLGLAQKASFEFHVTNWIGPSGDRPIAPEASRLSAVNTVCIHGLAEKDSLCPQLSPNHVKALGLPGDHHFGGDYDRLARIILSQTAPP